MKKKKNTTAGLTHLHRNHKDYPQKPSAKILETFSNAYPDRNYLISLDCPEFTSVCPVTGQPDFGRIVIVYEPDQTCIESKSLKLYLGAYRNQGAFAEQIVNQVRDDLVAVCQPRSLGVTGHFTARGGITIRVESSYESESSLSLR